jgi:hypothetical protein
MLPRFPLVNVFCLLTLLTSAQDISGVWVGNYRPILFASTPEKLVVEIFVYNDSLITGASHLYYKNDQYEHYKIYGRFKKKESVIYFSEDSTIAVKLGIWDKNCLGNYTMKLTSAGNMLEMRGRWEDNSTALFRCQSTGVWLQKEVDTGYQTNHFENRWIRTLKESQTYKVLLRSAMLKKIPSW